MFVPRDKHHTQVEGDKQHMCIRGGTNIQCVEGDKQPVCEVGDEQPVYWKEDQIGLLGPRMGEAHPLGAEVLLGGEAPNCALKFY